MTTVIYHSADYDGIFCREIARKFLPAAELIGWNFGDPKVPISSDGTTYILDLSPDCLADGDWEFSDLVWIDHHKTSIQKWSDAPIPGYRIDGVAACRLAWQWFQTRDENDELAHGGHVMRKLLPEKDLFVNRLVKEPLAVCLAGEYDIWDKRDPQAELLQYGLNTESNPEGVIRRLISADPVTFYTVLHFGLVVRRYARNTNASICKARTWLMQWEGLTFLCVNSARFNSLFFAAKDAPETGHDALLGFCYDGKCWTISLYHARHRTDLDLSEIAKKHGGGGHRGACGFTCKTLPFAL